MFHPRGVKGPPLICEIKCIFFVLITYLALHNDKYGIVTLLITIKKTKTYRMISFVTVCLQYDTMYHFIVVLCKTHASKSIQSLGFVINREI